jgi:glycosyltransferase involved in cell wall biosynthesis
VDPAIQLEQELTCAGSIRLQPSSAVQILHVIYDDPDNPWVGGGGAVRVLELYRHLAGAVDATVLSGAFPGGSDEVRDGVRYKRLGRPAPYAWSRLTFARAASKWLAQARYDAAVFDFSVYTPIFVPTARPVGITVHHVTAPTARHRWGRIAGPLIGRVERRMLRRARCFSATSGATYEQLRRIAPPGSTIAEVGAGVDDRLFDLQRQESEYLLYFGRMDWFQKGLDVLLRAFAELGADYPSLELRLAGRGRDLDRVEREAVNLGIRDKLVLLGSVSEAERMRLFAGAKVLLMPSRFEGFGMVAAEAMAAGVPIVAASAGSLPEVVAAPAGGILVPPGDASALASATASLLDSADHRAALSKTARASAERFRWSVVAGQHLEFLRAIARGC